MAKASASVLDAYVCPCLFGGKAKKKGRNMMPIIPWLKMMPYLDLIADACVAGVFSQGLGMIIQSSGDHHVLLFVLGCSLLF